MVGFPILVPVAFLFLLWVATGTLEKGPPCAVHFWNSPLCGYVVSNILGNIKVVSVAAVFDISQNEPFQHVKKVITMSVALLV